VLETAVPRRALLVCLLALTACAPRACSDGDERQLERAVQALVGEPGPRADDAERLLVAVGADAVLYLETGLYDAEPRARRRIIRTLAKIGLPTVLPILRHLAARDPDADVRSDASAALAKVETASSP
jgi:HEAT repeat protein